MAHSIRKEIELVQQSIESELKRSDTILISAYQNLAKLQVLGRIQDTMRGLHIPRFDDD